MSENVIQSINGTKINIQEELKTVAWNRRHNEFIKKHSCLHCDFFGEKCIDECGDEGFKCPITRVGTNIHHQYVVNNFAELCDIEIAPTLKMWNETVKGNSEFIRLCSTKNLSCLVWIPKIDILKKFQTDYKVGERNNKVLCRFTILDLHRRLREMLLYKPQSDTESNKIAKQLIDLLVPIDFIDMFTFKGNKNG